MFRCSVFDHLIRTNGSCLHPHLDVIPATPTTLKSFTKISSAKTTTAADFRKQLQERDEKRPWDHGTRCGTATVRFEAPLGVSDGKSRRRPCFF